MQNIEDMLEHLIQAEGGYVDDPDDPGGATNWGITHRTLASWRGNKVTKKDVQDLSMDEALDIYRSRYYIKTKINQLPKGIQPSAFDFTVNAGGNGIKILQRTVCKFGDKITVDGALGPNSIGAITKLYDKKGTFMVDAYGIERREFYYRIGDRRRNSRKYATRRDGTKGGWIIRAEHFITDKYDFTDAQHQQRVGGWS